MRKDFLGFVVMGFVVLTLIGHCLLSMWMEDLFGEVGGAWAFGITITLTLVNLVKPFVVHAINSVLHDEENRG